MHKLSDDSVGNKISHNSQLRLILLSGLGLSTPNHHSADF
ncbi:hypothetical protein AO365_0271 [Moraxella catarrhalis]|nr:hypothetical protein AO365_0271 [Moraxella catarrhalis]